jgi:protoheme IX farnesyltransferase
MRIIKSYLKLSRVWISLFAAFSAATGFFIGPSHPLSGILLPAGATFLLASGASALNQYQERKLDAGMKRTCQRPLPSGALSPEHALSFSMGLILSGLIMLAQTGKLQALGLGLFALFWYNGFYTYLKKRTAFASVPGAVVGMVAPAIGWVFAEGALFSARLAAICFIFFMWQIPHFWLLLLHHADEYKKAGLPSLIDIMRPTQISRVTFTWIFAASVASLLLPLYGAIKSPIVYFLFIPPSIWLIWNAGRLVKRRPVPSLSPELFRKINIYLLFVMSLLSLENIFPRLL